MKYRIFKYKWVRVLSHLIIGALATLAVIWIWEQYRENTYFENIEIKAVKNIPHLEQKTNGLNLYIDGKLISVILEVPEKNQYIFSFMGNGKKAIWHADYLKNKSRWQDSLYVNEGEKLYWNDLNCDGVFDVLKKSGNYYANIDGKWELIKIIGNKNNKKADFWNKSVYLNSNQKYKFNFEKGWQKVEE